MAIVILVLFCALMAAAAAYDLLTFRIPNAIVALLLALFLVPAWIHWRQIDWLLQIVPALGCLAIGYLLFARGYFGAGDAKLLAVAALWAGTNALMPLLLFVSLSGLLVMLVLLALRRLWPRIAPPAASAPAVLKPGAGVPYGVAIAAGSILTMLLFSQII